MPTDKIYYSLNIAPPLGQQLQSRKVVFFLLKFFRIWSKIPHFMLKNVKIVKAKKFCYIFAES